MVINKVKGVDNFYTGYQDVGEKRYFSAGNSRACVISNIMIDIYADRK